MNDGKSGKAESETSLGMCECAIAGVVNVRMRAAGVLFVVSRVCLVTETW